MTRTITIQHNGQTYYGQLATITSTTFGSSAHGVLECSLTCEWQNGGVSVGGYCLDEPVDRKDHRNYDRRGTAYGLDLLMKVMETVGVPRWEALKGASVIVLFEDENSLGSMSRGIAGVHDDKVLILEEHAKSWRDAAEAVSA